MFPLLARLCQPSEALVIHEAQLDDSPQPGREDVDNTNGIPKIVSVRGLLFH